MGTFEVEEPCMVSRCKGNIEDTLCSSCVDWYTLDWYKRTIQYIRQAAGLSILPRYLVASCIAVRDSANRRLEKLRIEGKLGR